MFSDLTEYLFDYLSSVVPSSLWSCFSGLPLFVVIVIVVVFSLITIPSFWTVVMDAGYGRVLNAVGSSANALTSSFYQFDPGMASLMSSNFCNDLNDFPATEEPVYLMGKKYSAIHALQEIKDDLRSLVWMTYRSGFPSIGGSGPTSDRGWGCMLRCGQMVLCNALVRLHLTRDWLWVPPREETNNGGDSIQTADEASSDPQCSEPPPRELPIEYMNIIRLFEDRKTAPYSIHQISQMGESEGRPVGTWFGPNTVAQALKKLATYEKTNEINIHVALDNLVIVNEIKSTPSRPWKPLILFIPLRLGLTDINPIYFRALKSSFHLSSSLGIIGGRPSHALYFVGYVGNEFLYLDPHTTQSVIDLSSNDPETFDDRSYHCLQVSRMDMSQLDPSISLCFFCETEADFDSWCSLAKNTFVRGEKQPLFELTKDRPSFWSSEITSSSDASAASPSEGFANYDLPSALPHQSRVKSSSASASASSPSRLPGPNVPIEIAKDASLLEEQGSPTYEDGHDDDFELLG